MICASVGVTVFDWALAVHSMRRCPAAAQVQSPIWALSIMPQGTFTLPVRSRLGGGAGRAAVAYVANSRVRGSWRAGCLPSFSLSGSIRVGSVLMMTLLRASGNVVSIFTDMAESFLVHADARVALRDPRGSWFRMKSWPSGGGGKAAAGIIERRRDVATWRRCFLRKANKGCVPLPRSFASGRRGRLSPHPRRTIHSFYLGRGSFMLVRA